MKRFLLLLLMFALPCAHAALPIQSWSLPNGARVLFVEHRAIPIIDISIEFDAGTRRDPAGKSGTAALTNSMLRRGVLAVKGEPALNEAEISDGFADTGAQPHFGAGSDRGGATLRTLSSQPESTAAISLLARIVAQPGFPETILTREKTRAKAAIKESETKPAAIAERAFMQALYGTHPYAFTPSTTSVESITRADLHAFHRQHYVASQAIISIVGDTTREHAEQIALQLTRRLPIKAETPLPTVAPVEAKAGQTRRIAHPASQAHILIGLPALDRGDPDFFALLVGNYTLGGGGFVSRLMHEVREKRGLSYGIHSSLNPRLQSGPFRIELQTQKAQTDEALNIVRTTLTDFLRDGSNEEELKAAKDNLIGGFGLRIDNNRKILGNVAIIGFYQLPLDYLDTWVVNIAKINADDVRAAFRRKIDFRKLSTIIVGAPD